MNENEKELSEKLGLKYYFNIPNSDYKKRKKALEQSKAIGKIIDVAYDRNNKLTKDEKAMYFKNGIEVSKFMYAYNHPKENILNQYTNEELTNKLKYITDELNKRLNKELIK